MSAPRVSFTYDFDQDPLLTTAVELAVEYLLPRSEVQFPCGHCDDDLAFHNLPFQMRIAIILAAEVVTISAGRLVRRQLFEPVLVILMQAALIVIDEDGRGDVHSVHQIKLVMAQLIASPERFEPSFALAQSCLISSRFRARRRGLRTRPSSA